MNIEIDPTKIEDEKTRQNVVVMANLLDKTLEDNDRLREENQRQRDEINRLKGEQGKPQIRPQSKKPTTISSEKERHKPKEPHEKPEESERRIDRTEIVTLDRQNLPDDLIFKGYDDVFVEDLVLRTDNVLFKKEKFYSPSQNKSYLASLPPGYDGQFGPALKSLILNTYFAGNMSEPKILEMIRGAGINISSGQLSNMIIHHQELFLAESAAVVEAGLSSTPWQHLDTTVTRVDGQNHYCHILCNPFYTAYHTNDGKDRLHILSALSGGRALLYQLNEIALSLLKSWGVAKRWQEALSVLTMDVDFHEEDLDAFLVGHLVMAGDTVKRAIKSALAIGSYRQQQNYPAIRLLITDDAPELSALSEEQALCWVHAARHYKKELNPRLTYLQKIKEQFMAKFWDYYEQLLAYRVTPSMALAEKLEKEFEKLFANQSGTGYLALDERIAKTYANKEKLLLVLKHPEINLHNNPAELGARQRVRKRDVSFGPRTKEGVCAWDCFMTLTATVRKLGINFQHYLYDRISQANQIPSLASLLREKAAQLSLGASFATS